MIKELILTEKKLYQTLLLLISIVLCACGGDDDISSPSEPVPPAGKSSWKVEISGKVTRGLELTDKGEATEKLTPIWEETDNIYVYYNNEKVGILHPKSGDTQGIIQLTGNLDNPATTPYTIGGSLEFYYRYDKELPSYAYNQDGTLETIAENFDYAKATSTITAVNETTHTLTIATASFASQEAIVRFTFNKEVKGIIISAETLSEDHIVIKTPDNAATTEIFAALPLKSEKKTTYYFAATIKNLNATRMSNSPGGWIGSMETTSALQNGKYYKTGTVTLTEPIVDLGLSVKWATVNVGATKPEDPGMYFAWASVVGYYPSDNHEFTLDNSPYYDTATQKYTKYIITDNHSFILSNDDAAYENWATGVNTGQRNWRVPSQDEMNELVSGTTQKYTTQNGVFGCKFTSKTNSKSIFIPAGGSISDQSWTGYGEEARCWSRTVNSNSSSVGYLIYAYRMRSGYNNGTGTQETKVLTIGRFHGLNVRPVLKPATN